MAISSTPRISKLDILDCLPVVSSISNLVQVVAYKALNKPLPKGSLASHLFFSLPVLGNLYKITQLICRLFYPPKNAVVPKAPQELSLSEPTSPAQESEQVPNTQIILYQPQRRESFATVETDDEDFFTACSGEEEDRGLDEVPAPVFAEAAQPPALRLEPVAGELRLSASTITLDESPVEGSSPEASPLSAYSAPSNESVQDRNKYQVSSLIEACGFTLQMAEFFVNHCLPTIEKMELNQAESDRLQNLSYDLYFGSKQQLKADMATFTAQPKLTVTFDPAHNQFLVEKNKLTASWGVFTKPLLAIKAHGKGMILETTGMVYGNMDLPLSFGEAQNIFAGKSFERCS
jgi:hypothetical protein